MRENFIVRQANEEERARIYEKHRPEREEDAKNALVYIALSDGDIIGRVFVFPREALCTVPGERWFVSNLFVNPEYRRQGIATALVDEIKRQAEERGVSILYGVVNATVRATMFWEKQGCTLCPIGQRIEEPDNPLYIGNWHHIMSCSVNRRPVERGKNSTAVISPAEPGEIRDLLDGLSRWVEDGRITKSTYDYLTSKRDALFGFTAKIPGENGTAGVILAHVDPMREPLDGNMWHISLYIENQHRRQGIGKALVYEMYSHARERGIMQLASAESSEDNAMFWQKCGFDIYTPGISKDTGKNVIISMVKIK